MPTIEEIGSSPLPQDYQPPIARIARPAAPPVDRRSSISSMAENPPKSCFQAILEGIGSFFKALWNCITCCCRKPSEQAAQKTASIRRLKEIIRLRLDDAVPALLGGKAILIIMADKKPIATYESCFTRAMLDELDDEVLQMQVPKGASLSMRIIVQQKIGDSSRYFDCDARLDASGDRRRTGSSTSLPLTAAEAQQFLRTFYTSPELGDHLVRYFLG